VLRPDSDNFKLYEYNENEAEEVDDVKYDDRDNPPNIDTVVHKLDDKISKTSASNASKKKDKVENKISREKEDHDLEVQNQELRENKEEDNTKASKLSINKDVSWLLGVLYVLISCVLSAFSGVYFEKVIKNSRQTSLIVRNIQLGEVYIYLYLYF